MLHTFFIIVYDMKTKKNQITINFAHSVDDEMRKYNDCRTLLVY